VKRFDLVAFDIDGTLVTSPGGLTVWEVLNERFAGGSRINRERYRAYREGRLTYADWVALDVRGWRDAGATRSDMVDALAPLRLVRGARRTLDALARAGSVLVAISGTLDLLIDTLLPDHPFDEVRANRITFDDHGRIAGWQATDHDMEGKAIALREIAERRGIPLERSAFVGDSSNDVWIAGAAGFTVAVRPRSAELERLAGAVVRDDDLTAILPHLLDGANPGD
jgi:phosphoserine phosphatase